MKEFPAIDRTQSIADLVEEMNDVMGEGKKIPEKKSKNREPLVFIGWTGYYASIGFG